MAAGRLDNAREKLNIVLAKLPDTDAGDKARGVFRTLEVKEDEAEAKADAAAKEKLEDTARKTAEANAKLLASVDDEIAKARALATEGFTEDDCGKALELLERALGRGNQAMDKLDAIEKDHAQDLGLVEDAKARRKKLIAGIVRVRIQRADLYMWRGSIPNAKKEIDAAKAIDPTNPAISSAMERLMAANDDDDPLERRELRERRQAGGSRFGGGGRGR
jgi:tetratricopeptide (TPR) repeat protein